MKQQYNRRDLRRLLSLVSFVAGVVWILAAFGVATGDQGLDTLYLTIGAIFCLAGAIWFLSLRAS